MMTAEDPESYEYHAVEGSYWSIDIMAEEGSKTYEYHVEIGLINLGIPCLGRT